MSKQGHFVVVPLGAWGHVRPLLHLSLNILSHHPGLHLTLLLAPSTIPQIKAELDSTAFKHIHTKNVQDRADALIDRMQLVPVRSGKFDLPEVFQPDTMAQEAMDFAGALPGFLGSLFAKEGTVAGTGERNKFEGVKPDFVIFDSFHSFIPDVVTQVLSDMKQKMVPLLAFLPSNAAACWNHFAPIEQGGQLAMIIKRVAEAVEAGGDPLEAYAKYGFAGEGKVVSPPGMTTMYDYEIYPQAGCVPLPPQIFQQVCGMYEGVRHDAVSAMILPVDVALEVDVKEAVEKMLGKELIMAGVQFPEAIWRGEVFERDQTKPDDLRVLEFLDRMEKKRGKHSVFYFSFGSVWWPATRPELVTYLLESLIENDIPFVFAHASFMEQLDPSVLAKINDREDSIEVKFAPQWAVLAHPATGFFISHCGSNSTAEAILSETPIAAFPFAADQGEFTYQLVQAGCAIDIKQVKTFKPTTFTKLYDGTEILGTEEAIKDELKGVWGRMRGDEGVKMRENVRKVKEIWKGSWEGGKAKEATEGLARFY